MKIDVIIRAPVYSINLGKVIDSVSMANNICPRFIIVSTGSALISKEILLRHCSRVEVIDCDRPFSYSGSLNKALPLVSASYTLIISSHTVLANSDAIEYAAKLLENINDMAAVTFSDLESNPLSYQVVDRNTFTGFNGCWNTACLYRSTLLQRRIFNERVFTAEDLEWSRWVLEDQGMSIALLSGCNRINLNPRKSSLIKRIKETVSVGYYVRPELTTSKAVVSRLFSSLKFFLSLKLRRALVELAVSIIFAISPLIKLDFDSGY